MKGQGYIMKKSMSICSRIAAAFITVGTLSTLCGGINVSAAHNGFYVSGTDIKDANGNNFVMRGVNIAHAWYQNDTETSIKGAKNNGANTVRVVVADGQRWSKTSKSDLENIVNMCKQNKLICVLEVHDATGSDNTYDLDNAVNYWIENKSVLQDNEEYVILNIANEWYGTWNGYSWAEGNKSAIKKLRDADIDNMIMVDCAGWGQYPACIKEYGRSVFEADSDRNTVFSIHMYEYAGGDAYTVKTNIDNALSIDVPVVIGEFGGQHTSGDVDEATIMSYCTEKNVGYLGWSWKGNSSDLSYLDIAYDFAGTSLTEWGNALINGSCGIKATSKTCSVYEQSHSHSYSEPVWNWNGTSSASVSFTCSCGDVKTVNANVTSQTTQPTAYADGKTVYTATAEFDGKTYTDKKEVTLNKLPAAPTVSYIPRIGCVELEWTSVEGAEKYGVCGYVSGRWQILSEVSGNSYTVNGLKAGTSYRMAVIAKVNGSWVYDLSNAVTVTPSAEYPTINSIVYNTQFHQFRLNWSPVRGAEKYCIAVKLAGRWKIQAYTDSTTFTSPKLRAGSSYDVVVCAVINGKPDTTNAAARAFKVTVK